MSVISGNQLFLPILSRPRLAWQANRRSFRIGFLIAAVAILNGIDLVYTVFADHLARTNHSDLFHEDNPIANTFLQLGLVPSLICFKILMVFCGLGLLWKVRRSRWAVPACWLLLAAYVILSIMWCEWVKDANMMMEMRLASPIP
jgi:Domain of unknown function (DUF5658)